MGMTDFQDESDFSIGATYKCEIRYRSNREEFRNSKAVISQQPEMGEPPNFAYNLLEGLPAPHKIFNIF